MKHHDAPVTAAPPTYAHQLGACSIGWSRSALHCHSSSPACACFLAALPVALASAPACSTPLPLHSPSRSTPGRLAHSIAPMALQHPGALATVNPQQGRGGWSGGCCSTCNSGVSSACFHHRMAPLAAAMVAVSRGCSNYVWRWLMLAAAGWPQAASTAVACCAWWFPARQRKGQADDEDGRQ